MPASDANVGGVVLCGGKSSRMGRAKAWLDVGGETSLQRVVRILSDVVTPIVVVAAHGQELPPLPEEVILVHDEREHLGPLAGMACGLARLEGSLEAAYVTGCDVPLLSPEFVRAVIEHLGDADCAVPVEEKFYHPLAGVYRTALSSRAMDLVRQDRLRPLFLIESVNAVRIPVDKLRVVDPELDSLRNMNTPREYERVVNEILNEILKGNAKNE